MLLSILPEMSYMGIRVFLMFINIIDLFHKFLHHNYAICYFLWTSMNGLNIRFSSRIWFISCICSAVKSECESLIIILSFHESSPYLKYLNIEHQLSNFDQIIFAPFKDRFNYSCLLENNPLNVVCLCVTISWL